MTSYDNLIQEDLQTAASKRSHVSGEKKSKGSHTIIHGLVGGMVGIIILAMVFSGSHKKEAQAALQSTSNQQNYNVELAANMARLNQELAHAKTEVSEVQVAKVNLIDTSKETIARQNQPTSMYSAPPPNSAANTVTATKTTENTTEKSPFSGNNAESQFGNQDTQTTSISATHISHPEVTIASGEFIHAVLETAVHSDLPGLVRAVIQKPVYAYVGLRPLIPAGSRLIGQYESAILQGQNRVMVVWNRIILPSGIAVQVNSPGADNLGRAGQGADSVNTHFIARFGESALLSLIGAGAATYGVNTNDDYNSASQYRMAIAQSFQQSAENSLQNTLPMKPTLHIYQGAQINVFVAHDLSFYNVLKQEDNFTSPSYIK